MKSYTDFVNQRAHDMIVMQHTNIKGPVMETDTERQGRTGLSSLKLTDEASAAVQKTPNRVSLSSIVEKIAHVDYLHPGRHPHMTLAIVTLANGYIVIGKSTPADPENFNKDLGQKFAYEDAVRKIWPLEAYLLRERMAET